MLICTGTCNIHSPCDMSLKPRRLQSKSIPCDLLLHLNCSIRALAGRVFYGAVKLGPLYGSNSMNHYCFFHLILIKLFNIAKLVHITMQGGMLCAVFEDALFLSVKMRAFGRAL